MSNAQFIDYIKQLIDVTDNLTVGICWAFSLAFLIKSIRVILSIYF